MTTIKNILMGAAAILLAGCVVTSVAPFYTDKDLVFEPGLLGDWTGDTNAAPGEIWKFDRNGTLAYRFTIIKPDAATVMDAHAFKLDGQLFLDIASMDQDIHVIPPHFLLKVDQLTPTLKLAQLNHDWLKDLVTKKASLIRHQFVKSGDKADDIRVVLTADTADLQKFVRGNVKTDGAWDGMELQRQARP